MNRFQASALHLACGALFLSIIFISIYLLWYPGPLFFAANGTDIMTIVITVDLVAGPLITLIIFKKDKPSLKFDMSCIITIQILFIFYGVWVFYSARPVYYAFIGNQFYLTTANEIEAPSSEPDSFKDDNFQLPMFGPVPVGIEVPDDPKTSERLAFASFSGSGPQNFLDLHIPYDSISARVIASGLKPEQITEINAEQIDYLTAYSKHKKSQSNDDVLFLPLQTKDNTLYLAINAASGEIITPLSVSK